VLVSPAVSTSRPRPTGRMPRLAEPTGHVFLREGKRGGVWYAKYRLPDGRQVKKRIGPAGPVTRRSAEAWLRGVLDEARHRRYKKALVRAGLRDLRFHDLRHTFGTQVIATASILKVKEWMGHADVDTTMRYLHFAPSGADAELVAAAFALATPAPDPRSVPDPQLWPDRCPASQRSTDPRSNLRWRPIRSEGSGSCSRRAYSRRSTAGRRAAPRHHPSQQRRVERHTLRVFFGDCAAARAPLDRIRVTAPGRRGRLPLPRFCEPLVRAPPRGVAGPPTRPRLQQEPERHQPDHRNDGPGRVEHSRHANDRASEQYAAPQRPRLISHRRFRDPVHDPPAQQAGWSSPAPAGCA